MRIACPSCAVTYEVPGNRLTAGRVVRCARCGHEWAPEHPDAPEPDPHSFDERGERTDVDVEGPEPSAMDIFALRSKLSPPDRRLQAAWIASVTVLLLLLGSAVMWRSAVMTSWPASERLYSWIGLQPAKAPAKTADAGLPHHR